jgi:hypothetical protein
MNKIIPYMCVCLAASSELGLAQVNTQVNMDSGGQTVADQNNTTLTAGPAGDGNGAVLQLGYYTGATNSNSNFAGNWVPLTGQGSANTAIVLASAPPEQYNQTSIGDRNSDTANTDGTFSLQLLFGTYPGSSSDLPAAGTILSIRFYNGSTVANSTFFNTVSNDAWLWYGPAPVPQYPVISISLDNSNLEWESVERLGQEGNSAFHTTIAMPEPTTYALLGFGALGMMVLCRQTKK